MTKILIVGAGVVGQATGKGLIKKGHEVTFIDINVTTVNTLKKEGLMIYFPAQIDKIDPEIEIVMFCVSTPPRKDGSVNLDFIVSAIKTYGEWLKEYKGRQKNICPLIVIRSTVPPFTTRKILLPLLEKTYGMKAGEDFGLCMQPEYLRAVSREKDFLNPWVIVIGQYDENSGDELEKLYIDFGGEIIRTSLEVAELAKYIHNCFNATKISFANELWLLGEKIGIDANLALKITAKTAEGSWNQDYGTVGGQPYGGTCLPKDTLGLNFFAGEKEVSMSLLPAVISVNNKMEALAKKGIIPSASDVGLKWRRSPKTL